MVMMMMMTIPSNAGYFIFAISRFRTDNFFLAAAVAALEAAAPVAAGLEAAGLGGLPRLPVIPPPLTARLAFIFVLGSVATAAGILSLKKAVGC